MVKNAIYVYFQYRTLNKVPLMMREYGYEPKLFIDGEVGCNYDKKYSISGISKYVIKTLENLDDNSIYCTSLMEEYLSKNIFLPEKIEKVLKDNLFTLVDQSTRWDRYLKKTYQDYLNYIFTMARFAYSYMVLENIEVVFFTHFCHLGIDLIFYLIAKELGIKTIFMNPDFEMETNKYLVIYSDTLDFDKIFNKMRKRRDCNFTIKEGFEKNLSYMKKLNLVTGKSIKFKYSIFLRFLLSIFTFKKEKPNLRYFYLLKRYFQERECLLLRDSIIKQVDWSKKYVYFGLHMQPELTTSFYGGKYTDQLLAIEKISSMLPPDWVIYVKENPKQTFLNRGNIFYERLKNIPKVQLVPIDTNTYELMEKSQFVASITGTMLYESVCGGKPGLMFGNYWYSELPGVFKYREDLTVEEIVKCKIDHKEVENKINDFYSKCEEIIIENNMLDCLSKSQKYNQEENHKKVVKLLLELEQGETYVK